MDEIGLETTHTDTKIKVTHRNQVMYMAIKKRWSIRRIRKENCKKNGIGRSLENQT